MTKKFLAITTALALTAPFLATAKKQPQTAVETNNFIVPPIENLTVAETVSTGSCRCCRDDLPLQFAEYIIAPIPRPKNNPNYCPRSEGYTTPTSTVELVADYTAPLHCLEVNCGLGVYSLRKDSDKECCSFCGALKPANL